MLLLFSRFSYLANDAQDADIHRKALEYEFPMVVMTGSAGDGSLGTEFLAFRINASNVIMSALYPDNGELILRMYEYKGESVEAEVSLFSGPAQMTEVNMLGEQQGMVTVPLKFSPWQIRSVQIDKSRLTGSGL